MNVRTNAFPFIFSNKVKISVKLILLFVLRSVDKCIKLFSRVENICRGSHFCLWLCVHPCPQDLSARLYHETDYSSLFVEELTQQDSNLNCILQCEICYSAIFYLCWHWRVCLVCATGRKWKNFQESANIPQIKFPIQDYFLQKNLLFRVLCYLYKHFITQCCLLQEIIIDQSYLLLPDLVLKSVTNQLTNQWKAGCSKGE